MTAAYPVKRRLSRERALANAFLLLIACAAPIVGVLALYISLLSAIAVGWFALSFILLSILPFTIACGLVRRRPWSRYLAVGAFFGGTIVFLAPGTVLVALALATAGLALNCRSVRAQFLDRPSDRPVSGDVPRGDGLGIASVVITLVGSLAMFSLGILIGPGAARVHLMVITGVAVVSTALAVRSIAKSDAPR